MSLKPQIKTADPPHAKRMRLKIAIACRRCRSRKVKCDGLRPACGNCQKKETDRASCTYKTHGPNDEHLPQGSPSRFRPPVSIEQQNGQEIRAVCGAREVFAGEVRAAIDARLGIPPSGNPSFGPMSDAPLFGTLCRRQVTESTAHHADNVLPPRKHADYLMDIYWRHIQPLEPFLEQEGFCLSYNAMFAGNPLEVDERVFLSSLNTVFALSTQLQERLPADQREEASNTYFHRAWTLLRPETIIWEPGSPEVIQCLLLMGRYLQCTNNPHQTWMAVGSAVRIAQSLGFHIPRMSSSSPPSRECRLRRQLWQCCIFMDRQISWLLGRTSTVSLTLSPADIDSLYDHDLEEQPNMHPGVYFTKMLELYEIYNHIAISQMPASEIIGDNLGLPQLYQSGECSENILKLENSLKNWEKTLPAPLGFDAFSQDVTDDILHRQQLIIRLRLLHSRIILFRPSLARLCLSQSQTAQVSTVVQNLGDHLSQGCASLCIESAQNMIALVHEQHMPDMMIGILPWWQRIFYLHLAGTILVAAMLRTEQFTPMVSLSWSRLMSALRAHEHLSPFVQQCVATFQTLSNKISQTHNPGGGSQFTQPEGLSNIYFQDVFQDMGFDADNFLFGKEDWTWLSNLDLV